MILELSLTIGGVLALYCLKDALSTFKKGDKQTSWDDLPESVTTKLKAASEYNKHCKALYRIIPSRGVMEIRHSMDGDLYASMYVKQRKIVIQVHKCLKANADHTVSDTFLYKIDGKGFMPYTFALNEMVTLVEQEYCSTF